jgi:hypothetical protein
MMPQGISLIILRGRKGDTAYFKTKSLLSPHLFIINKAMTLKFILTRDSKEVFVYHQNGSKEYPNSFIIKFIPENFRNISCVDIQSMKNLRQKFEELYNFLQENRLLPKKKNKWLEVDIWEYVMLKMDEIIKFKDGELKDRNLTRWIK